MCSKRLSLKRMLNDLKNIKKFNLNYRTIIDSKEKDRKLKRNKRNFKKKKST